MAISLQERLNQRNENRGTGSNREQALNFDKLDVKFWKPKKDKNYINILPYKIATTNHPLVKSKDAEVGEDDFVLDLWIHQYVGPGNADVICPNRTFGKKCPICEAGNEFKDEGKEKEAQKCWPTHKVAYNIVDEKDRDAGVKVWIGSFKYFHDELMNEAGDAGENGEVVNFIDFKKGKVVKFRADEESFDKRKYFKFKSFKFLDRDEPLNKELLKDILSLDQFMKIHSYDEIKAIFYGDDADVEDDDDDEEDRKPKGKKAVIEDDDDEEEEDDDDDDD